MEVAPEESPEDLWLCLLEKVLLTLMEATLSFESHIVEFV